MVLGPRRPPVTWLAKSSDLAKKVFTHEEFDMGIKAAKRWVFALALMGLTAGAARADLITFSGVPGGFFVGPFSEGAFTYNTAAGTLFADSANGNPPPSMSGGILPSATLSIVRTDGGLFTFDG